MYAVSGYQRLHHIIRQCKLLMKPDNSWAKNIPLESLTAQYIIIWEEELKNKRNMYRKQDTGFLKTGKWIVQGWHLSNDKFQADHYHIIHQQNKQYIVVTIRYEAIIKIFFFKSSKISFGYIRTHYPHTNIGDKLNCRSHKWKFKMNLNLINSTFPPVSWDICQNNLVWTVNFI